MLSFHGKTEKSDSARFEKIRGPIRPTLGSKSLKAHGRDPQPQIFKIVDQRFVQAHTIKALHLNMTISEQQIARVQQPAPHFAGKAVVNGQFEDVSLDQLRGKWVLLFFYPMGIGFLQVTAKNRTNKPGI